MDGTTLREMQAPLKARYRDEPGSALTALHATGSFDQPGITCTVDTWAGPVRAGLHPATGGDGDDACSGDLLMQAVLACAGVTLRSVATALGIDVRNASLRADGHFDARGTLGVTRTAPVGAQGIQVLAELDTDADDEALARLAALTERYCVVGQSLAEPPIIKVQRMTRPA
ncbi:MAG: OsmC family protein [Actinomycetota bacterium]